MKEIIITDNHKIPKEFRGRKLYSKGTLDNPSFASSGSSSKKSFELITIDNDDDDDDDYEPDDWYFTKPMKTKTTFLIPVNYVRLKS